MTRTSTRAPDFVRDLRRHGDRPAVLSASRTLTYLELADRVESAARGMGSGRRLVLVEGRNDLDVVVGYLGALQAGHVALLAPGGSPACRSALHASYDPDVVVRPGTAQVQELRAGSAHELHPDLAVLLTTSGSTGSPKLVRLSYDNLEANAEQVAAALAVRPTDRAVTTLPLHYCFGLSVLHSHLLRGASIVLTDRSVVDEAFWELFAAQRCTTLAAVPYTFELLERAGFADRELPHLRAVQQAGGRLAPDQVRRWARVGRRRGWDLFVMYGQTEATARIAVLPPDLADTHPGSIGLPVPGGALRLDPVPESPEAGTGELVYDGPNVMLGYAHDRADLALGRIVTELRTGDLARVGSGGLLEITGRRNRIAKPFGTRIDLQHLEQQLAAVGRTAACVEGEGGLVIAVEGSAADDVHRLVRRTCGLPPQAVQVVPVDVLPRTPTGKVDLAAVRALDRPPVPVPDDLLGLYAAVLDRPDVTGDDTFLGLGGDSLSYVEMSLRLEQALGHLPPQWHSTRVADLQRSVPQRRRRGRTVETGVLLRALAIVLVVATHANALSVVGGAHVLIGLAGYNLARFQLSATAVGRERVRRLLRSTARIAVPSIAWIAAAVAVTSAVGVRDGYGLPNVVLLNHALGSDTWTDGWHWWFVESLVCLVVLLAAVLAVPTVDRAERAAPFAFAAGLVGVGLVLRTDLAGLELGPGGIHTPQAVLFLFGLGWAAARSRAAWQRWAVTAAAALAVPGFAGEPQREVVVLAGLLLLVWVPTLRVPALLARLVGPLAAGSLYVYVTHWQVYPHLEADAPWLATAASFAVGLAYWQVVERVDRWRCGRC